LRPTPARCGFNNTNPAEYVRMESVTPPQTYRGKKNVMKPQMFDGKEPINSFIAHFEVCAQFNDWQPAEKIAWLQWALKGRAQQVLWDLPPSQWSNL